MTAPALHGLVVGVLRGLDPSTVADRALPEILRPTPKQPSEPIQWAPWTEEEAREDPLWAAVTAAVDSSLAMPSRDAGLDRSPLRVLASTYQELLRAGLTDRVACSRVTGLAAFAFRRCLVRQATRSLADMPEGAEFRRELEALLVVDATTGRLHEDRPRQALMVTYSVFGGLPTQTIARMIGLATRVTHLTVGKGAGRVRAELSHRGLWP